MNNNIEQKFKAGEVVRLKSGGPKMTIAWLEFHHNMSSNQYDIFTGEVLCEWFDDKELKQSKFQQNSLEKITE